MCVDHRVEIAGGVLLTLAVVGAVILTVVYRSGHLVFSLQRFKFNYPLKFRLKSRLCLLTAASVPRERLFRSAGCTR